MNVGSALTEAMTALVGQKRAVGYKYLAEAHTLARFEAFCRTEFPGLETVSEESVQAWIAAARRRGVKPSTVQNLATPIRELARWLNRHGTKAYVLPAGMLPQPARYVPYIYTDTELAAFFTQTDRCHYCLQVPLRHLIMPVLFRTIYACGLRCSEARLLRVEDVDITTGVLQIRDAKGGKTGKSRSPRRCASGSPTTTTGPRHTQPGEVNGSFPATQGARSRSSTSTTTFAGFCGRPASLTAGWATAPESMTCGTFLR